MNYIITYNHGMSSRKRKITEETEDLKINSNTWAG